MPDHADQRLSRIRQLAAMEQYDPMTPTLTDRMEEIEKLAADLQASTNLAARKMFDPDRVQYEIEIRFNGSLFKDLDVPRASVTSVCYDRDKAYREARRHASVNNMVDRAIVQTLHIYAVGEDEIKPRNIPK